MAKKVNNRFRKVLYGIGEGGGWRGGGCKSGYKDCFRSQKESNEFKSISKLK
jgi:hypothetical protein